MAEVNYPRKLQKKKKKSKQNHVASKANKAVETSQVSTLITDTTKSSTPRRNAAYALNQLNDFVSSAHIRGSIEAKAVADLKKLKNLAFEHDVESKEFQLYDLRKVGISEDDVPGLDSFIYLSRIRWGQYIGSFKSKLLRIMFYVLKTTELEDEEFARLVAHHWRPDAAVSFRPLLCETLCNSELRQAAEKFVNADGEALQKKRELLIQHLKEEYPRGKSIDLWDIRIISLCGDDTKRIIPDEISDIRLNNKKLSRLNIDALCNVTRHSSLLNFLFMQQCNLTSELLQMLNDGLQNSKLKISYLSVSENKNMGVHGIGCIGMIVKNRSVDRLAMVSCGLKHEELEAFRRHSGGAKVSVLIVSANMDMGVDGLGCVGKIVKSNNVENLGMVLCKLKPEELKSFNIHSNGAKIFKLDVSWNKNMGANGLGCIGKIVKKTDVKKLKMQGCELTHEGLKSFKEHSNGAKITKLDVSCNKNMSANGLGCVGTLVTNNGISKLKLDSCKLNHEELESFNKHLNSAKIKQLDLSDQVGYKVGYDLPWDDICNLLPNVTDYLNLYYNEFGIEKISLLQDSLHCLHPTELKINVKHHDGYELPDLTSELTSEEYWKFPNAAEYLQRMEEILRMAKLSPSKPTSSYSYSD